jgi:glycosyltransferase involved in cell wall biosynthesis
MISVIIPSYNSESTIAKCLHSLQHQSYRGEYEVILVDSSYDSTPQIVSSSYPEVKLISLDEKTNPGTARNIGIKEAEGDILAFIDSDCVATYDWLDKIATAHSSSYNVIGGSVSNENNNDSPIAWAGYMAEFREFIPELPKREVTHIPTCNISYKKKIFQQHGLFQGEYYPQEDLLFNHNLSSQGEKILFDPTIKVYHHHRTKLKDYLLHQKKIGSITSKVLRKIKLEGSFIARHPILAIFLLPLLPAVKFIRTLSVFLRLQFQVISRRPLIILVFAGGLFFWMIGFAEGLLMQSSDLKGTSY